MRNQSIMSLIVKLSWMDSQHRQSLLTYGWDFKQVIDLRAK